MTQHRTVDVAFPPPPPPPVMPGYPPLPPGPPPADTHRRRWPVLVAAGVVGAVVAALAAAVITVQARDTIKAKASEAHAPVTLTVPAPTPAPPAPLPTAQADRQTCEQGWIPAGRLVDSGKAALATLPEGIKIGDPVVPTNPDWTATAQRAGDSYRQASEALKSAIAPGTTPILAEAASSAAKALRVLGDAISTNDLIVGNAIEIGNATAKQVGVLCYRLAP
jgi:hypothetical protein